MTTLFLVYSAHIVVCAFAYLSIPFSLILVVVSLLGMCANYLLVCICVVYIAYTLPLVAFAFVAFSLSISFILMNFVFVAFGNGFQVK